MKKKAFFAGALLMTFLSAGNVHAQLNTNPNKFLGNITTRGQVNGGGYEFKSKWNQLTCENETKWSSVQGGGSNSWNWGGADNAYNYCKNNGLLFKFHCLAWGSQYPGWIENLSDEERYNAIVKWMDAVKKRYPDIKMFDVVNEAVDGHQAGTHFFQDALGGKGISNWDWIITAFELAHERWPDAILIYNDFNTFQWQRQQFIDLCTALRDYGAPIDAYGCQSHDLTGYGLNNFKSAMDQIQNALKMPMYSTEYDIGTDDDNQQLTNYKEQIPYMWEKDYFAGLTLWGSTYGATWTTNGNSGILNKNGKNRPAYDWLVEYMKTDAAKNAKSPFPGMKKQVDLYIKPMIPRFSVGEEGIIDLRARMIDKKRSIARIDFYANNQLYCTLTEAPWVVKYTPGKMGDIPLKAVLVAEDGAEYTRYGSVKVVEGRAPYKTRIAIPGLLQAENFDKGAEGISFHDSDYSNKGNKTDYRTDGNKGGGVDLSSGNSGTVVSQTVDGEWLEYSVNVKQEGKYAIELTATSGVEDAAICLAMKDSTGALNVISDTLTIPCYQKGKWTKYQNFYFRLPADLQMGEQIMRLCIVKGGSYIDKIKFVKLDFNNDLAVSVKADRTQAYEGDTIKITADAKGGDAIKNVTLYVNHVLAKTFTAAPYELDYKVGNSGLYEIEAFVTDTAGLVSDMASFAVQVDKERIPFNGVKEIPGTFEAEDFDSMGEGYSFHDSDDTDQGAAKYRTDNGGIDIQKANNGYVIGYTEVNEWMDYSVDVKQSGYYNFTMTCSTNTEQGQVQLFTVDAQGNETSLCKKKVAAYKNWESYKTPVTTSLTAPLMAGPQILRVKILTPLNIDSFTLTLNEEKTQAWLETGMESLVAAVAGTYTVYTLGGAKVGQFAAAAGDNLTAKTLSVAGQSGTYVIKNVSTGDAKTLQVK